MIDDDINIARRHRHGRAWEGKVASGSGWGWVVLVVLAVAAYCASDIR